MEKEKSRENGCGESRETPELHWSSGVLPRSAIKKVDVEGNGRSQNIRNDPFSIFPLVGDNYPTISAIGYAVGIYLFISIPVNGFAATQTEKGQRESMVKGLAFCSGTTLGVMSTMECPIRNVRKGFRIRVIQPEGIIAL